MLAGAESSLAAAARRRGTPAQAARRIVPASMTIAVVDTRSARVLISARIAVRITRSHGERVTPLLRKCPQKKRPVRRHAGPAATDASPLLERRRGSGRAGPARRLESGLSRPPDLLVGAGQRGAERRARLLLLLETVVRVAQLERDEVVGRLQGADGLEVDEAQLLERGLILRIVGDGGLERLARRGLFAAPERVVALLEQALLLGV